ncbi:MAG: hypothetical protein AAGB29_08395 [Planctomycetota bacterium]
MNPGAATTAGVPAAVAAQQVIAEATKASGVIVRVEPRDFLTIVELNDEPLVVCATGGFFSKNYQYLTSYRGLAFFTKTKTMLTFGPACALVLADKIWLPG